MIALQLVIGVAFFGFVLLKIVHNMGQQKNDSYNEKYLNIKKILK